ncbi:MAG: hypothetical protein NTW87_09920 [Planctomycetota bacterium]|nr:hypothetical protein [Planctomycetota bacterium]
MIALFFGIIIGAVGGWFGRDVVKRIAVKPLATGAAQDTRDCAKQEVKPLATKAAQNTLASFVRFHGRLNSGLNKMDYDKSVSDLNGDLQVYLASEGADASPEFNKLLGEAVEHYRMAGPFWELRVHLEDPHMMMDLYHESKVGIISNDGTLRPTAQILEELATKWKTDATNKHTVLCLLGLKRKGDYTEGDSLFNKMRQESQALAKYGPDPMQAAWCVAGQKISSAQDLVKKQ